MSDELNKDFVRKQSDVYDKKVVSGKSGIKDEVDILIEEARKAGYTSVKDYVKDVYKTWDEKVQLNVLEGIYESFLEAVQNEMSKEPYAKGCWSAEDNFELWLSFSLKCIEKRLDDMKWRINNPSPSFSGLLPYIDDMKDVPDGVGEALTKEDYEFYELILRKTKELIFDVLNNPEKLKKLMGQIEYNSKLKFEANFIGG